MVSVLALLGISAIILALVCYTKMIQVRDLGAIGTYTIIGLLSVFLDLIIETLGTTVGSSVDIWEYTNSAFFLFGTVPIELTLLFFGYGVVLSHISLHWIPFEMENNPVTNRISLVIIVFSFFLLVGYLFRMGSTFLFIAPLGLLGWENIPPEGRERSLYIAIIVGFLDLVFELSAIYVGDYTYGNGFGIALPVKYALLTLAGIGISQWIHKTIFAKFFPLINPQESDSQ